MKGTAPGVRHSDMHPATRARVDRQADVGRAVALYGDARALHERAEVNRPFVERRRRELHEAIGRLVDAAIAEGAAGAAGEGRGGG